MLYKWIFRMIAAILLIGLFGHTFENGQAVPSRQDENPPIERKRSNERYDGPEERFLPGGAGNEIKPPDVPMHEDTQAPESLTWPWGRVVFQTYRHDNWDIYLYNTHDQTETRLTYTGSSDIHPRLSWMCNSIIFASDRTGNYEIYRMNLDGSGVTQLTFNTKDDVNPSWSYDQSKILFQSYRDNQSEVYVMDLDGGNQTRLTWHDGYDGDPAWSPDGSKIAFTGERVGGLRIHIMNPDGSGVVQLSTQGDSENPVWSPDGSQIAYDANNFGGMGHEIWLMNADGSNQHIIFEPWDPNIDCIMRSWKNTAGGIGFTRLWLVNVGGQWYWSSAYLYIMSPTSYYSSLISNDDLAWNPHMETTDDAPPVTSMSSLPTQSASTFRLQWSGQDVGPSGLAYYQLQYKDGENGEWTDFGYNPLHTFEYFSGVGGHTYYFRVRGRDNANSLEPWPADYDAMTAVEALSPETSVQTLPSHLKNHSVIHWGGVDPGGSYIASYDVQYRDAQNVEWTDWINNTTQTSAVFDGEPGRMYYFRSRAIDQAQNQESWPANSGDAFTTIHSWSITGNITDLDGNPLQDVQITIAPGLITSTLSGQNGEYRAYLLEENDNYTVEWQKAGYQSVPVTVFTDDQDAQADIVLPPQDNGIENGSFEAGGLSPYWIATGNLLPQISSLARNTGAKGAAFGEVGDFNLSAPVNLSDTFDASTQPKMALDATGKVHIVWTETYDNVSRIYYTQRDINGNWLETVQDISTPYGGADPQIVVDSNGTVTAAWLSGSQILSARRENGIWSTPHPMVTDAIRSYPPKLYLDHSGTIHMAWFASPNIYGIKLYYASYTSDWSAVESVSFSYCSHMPWFQVEVDKVGVVHVIAGGNDPWGGMVYYYLRRTSQGQWSDPYVYIDSNYILNDSSRMIVNSRNDINLFFVAGFDSQYQLMFRERMDGEWGRQIYTDYRIPDQKIRLAIDSQDTLYATWISGSPYYGEAVMYWLFRDGDGRWGQERVIPGMGKSSDAELILAEDGRLHVAGPNLDGGLLYTFQLSNGEWSMPFNVIGTNQAVNGFDFELDAQNNPHILWSNGNEVYYVGPRSVSQEKTSVLEQEITIPDAMTSPVLSFQYELDFQHSGGDSWFDVQLETITQTVTLFTASSPTAGWEHPRIDMSPWRGQTVEVRFRLHQAPGYESAWAFLDDVALGSVYPDVWANGFASPGAVQPGDQVIYDITYGNCGSALSEGNLITVTLPSTLTFVSASITPTIISDTLVWDVGALPAHSGPQHIQIVVALDESIPLGSHASLPVEIATISTELEISNNRTLIPVFIGYRMFLPLSGK